MQHRNLSSLLKNASGCIVEIINCFAETELILYSVRSKLIFCIQSNLWLREIILGRSFHDAHLNILNITQIRTVIRERIP